VVCLSSDLLSHFENAFLAKCSKTLRPKPDELG
jgi:hypothetical protein